MNKAFTILILLFFAFTLQSGCKKDCEGVNLPPLSLTGKNIFACKINDKCWIAQGYTDFGTALYIPAISGGFWPQANSNKMNLYIVAQRPYIEEMELFIRNESADRFLKPGIYTLNKKTFSLQWASSFNSHLVKDYGAYNRNTTDSSHTGWIEILKSDSANKIISGQFEFNIPGYAVTKGRFDIKN
jgi:hypothetical protein